jgi:hypothetical protein
LPACSPGEVRRVIAAARLLVLLALAAPAVAAAGPSIHCQGGLVSEGDHRIDLLGKCGAPTLRQERVEERAVLASERLGNGRRVALERRVSVVVEDWSYDLGPHAFVHVVRLENGRVVAIERLGYGYRDPAQGPPPPPAAPCDLSGVHDGDGELDLLARCAEPAVVDAWDETREQLVDDGAGGVVAGAAATVRVEVWSYDLGRDRLVRFVRLENGQVVRVWSGGYGYAR